MLHIREIPTGKTYGMTCALHVEATLRVRTAGIIEKRGPENYIRKKKKSSFMDSSENQWRDLLGEGR
jgi:hypothetical protein